MADRTVALSLTPPWTWAILHAGKRIENRDWRNGCSRRGPIWLHAAQGIGSRAAFAQVVEAVWAATPFLPGGVDAVDRMREDGTIVRCDRHVHAVGPKLARGAIVGRANIVGVVERAPNVDKGEFDWMVFREHGQSVPRAMTDTERAWWMGGFALLLEDVVALTEPVPCKGALGFWKVPEDVEAKCLAQLPEAP